MDLGKVPIQHFSATAPYGDGYTVLIGTIMYVYTYIYALPDGYVWLRTRYKHLQHVPVISGLPRYHRAQGHKVVRGHRADKSPPVASFLGMVQEAVFGLIKVLGWARIA